MKTLRVINKFQLLLVALLLGLTGCLESPKEEDIPNKKDGAEVMFSINLPGKAAPATRALSELEENEVRTVEILLFDAQTKELAHTPIYANNISETESITQKTFAVRIPKGTYEIMLFANSRNIFAEAPLVEGEGQETTLAKLTVDMPSMGWCADESRGDEYLIPMWGVIKDVVTVSGDMSISGVYLHRMVSRIDVIVTDKAESEGNFELTDIKLYNVQSKGRVAPMMDNWSRDGVINEGTPKEQRVGKAIDPSLAYGASVHAPISYGSSIQDKLRSIGEIYIFESQKAAHNADQEAFFILLKAKYDGVDGWYRVDIADYTNPSNVEYMDVLRNSLYRIVITNVSGTGHKDEEEAKENPSSNIEIEVTLWNEHGLGEIIFDGQNFLSIDPYNAVHDMAAADDLEITIRTDYLNSLPNARVSTTPNEDGVLMGGGFWLSEKGISEGTDYDIDGKLGKEYKLRYEISENGEENQRIAYFLIDVGRLTGVVKVTQTTELGMVTVSFQHQNENGVWVPVDKMRIVQKGAAGEVEEKKYRLVWTPSSEPLQLDIESKIGDNLEIVWDGSDGHDVPVNGELRGGLIQYSVRPLPAEGYQPGSFKKAFLEMTATVGSSNNKAMANLEIEQFIEDIYIESTAIPMDGKFGHYAVVKSNIPWQLKANINANGPKSIQKEVGVVTSVNSVNIGYISNKFGDTAGAVVVAKGDSNLPNGTKVSINTVDDIFSVSESKIFEGELGLYGEKDGGGAPFYQEIIPCLSGVAHDNREANCYVLNPSAGLSILIPVRAANGVFGQKEVNKLWQTLSKGGTTMSPKIDVNTQFGAKLVWSDVPTSDGKGLGEDGLIQEVIPVRGSGSHLGYVLVNPGQAGVGKEGNAVVAVTGSNGEILWSWHIWVTDGMKYSKASMGGTLKGGFRGTEKDYKGAKNGDGWLDRNLGALGNGFTKEGSKSLPIEELDKSAGLLYQWGRKDPFAGSSSVTGFKERKLYDATGEISKSYISSTVDLNWSIANPHVFIQSSTDWLTTGRELMWGITIAIFDSGKTIFDPCPAGWRVALGGVWGLSWGSSGSFNYGRYSENLIYKGDFYPAAGFRTNTAMMGTGSVGYCWSRTPLLSSRASTFMVNSSTFNVNASSNRSYGMAVRCEADDGIL